MEVRVVVAVLTQLKKSGEGGCIMSDGAGMDDEDGGWRHDHAGCC